MNSTEKIHPKQVGVKTSSWPFSFNEEWNGWGWGVFLAELAIAFGFLIFGLTHFAFASRQPGAYTFRSAPQPIEQSLRLDVQGPVSWKDGIARIQDQRTGAIYQLSNSEEIRSLYERGVRNAVVSGTLLGTGGDNATIEVESTTAIQ